jgi:hypothetical protein
MDFLFVRNIKDLFQFPRHQPDDISAPEILSFKSSQRLLNPNSPPATQTPHHDDATGDRTASAAVDQSDNDSDQQSDGQRAPKR